MTIDPTLVDAATEAREVAYAPYSGFRVGAAIQLDDGRVFTGVNVENSSYGLTVCAERNAIASAVRAGAKPGSLAAVMIAAEAETATPPCGACRQVLLEFGRADTAVGMHNLRSGTTDTTTLGNLLPRPFDSSNLTGP